MRKLLIAVLLLVIAPLHPNAGSAPEEAATDSRIYDVTALVHHGTERQTTFTRIVADYEERPAKVYGNLYGPYYSSGTSPNRVDVDRLEELIYKAIGLGSPRAGQRSDVRFVETRSRVLAYVRATRESHELIEFMIDKIRSYVTARIRLSVYRDNELWGTASGGVGEEFHVAHSSSNTFRWDFERIPGPYDQLRMTNLLGGTEVSLSAVVLPNGQLRIQGELTERELLRFRTIETQGGTVDLPEFTARYQPFLADVSDPGEVEIDFAGVTWKLRVSCGTKMPDVQRDLPGGGTLVLRNYLGLLRRYQLIQNPFKPYNWFGLGSRWDSSRSRYDAAGTIDEHLFDLEQIELPGLEEERFGYGAVYIWSRDGLPQEKVAAAEQSWHRLKDRLDQVGDVQRGRFRLRAWRVPADRVDEAPQSLGSPLSSCEFSLLEGQPVSWQDLRVRTLIDEYAVGVGPGVRSSWHGFAASGSYACLDWRGGTVEARYIQGNLPDEIEQFDTGLREPGPLIVDCQQLHRLDLKWSTQLEAGQSSTSISPAGDGQVLVGVLERLE